MCNLEFAIMASADDQHFPDVVAGEEEFDGGEVAEEGFDVAVVEDALQAEAFANGGVNGSRGSASCFAAQDDGLHFQRVFSDDVKAVAGRIWPGILGMKKSQHHSARL